MGKVLQKWIIFAIVTTLISGFVGVVIQQVYRHMADDPQIYMARDTAYELANNATVKLKPHRDLANIDGPFTIIFDAQGHVTQSEIVIDGQSPNLPAGVLAYAKDHGEDRVTWQPKDDLRVATFVVAYPNGYVLVGRSLRQTEIRILQLEQSVFIFWLTSNAIIFIVITLLPKNKKHG